MKHLFTALLLWIATGLIAQEYNNQNHTDVKYETPSAHKIGVSLQLVGGPYKKFEDDNGFIARGLELNLHTNKLLFSLQFYRFSEFHLFDNSAERAQVGFKIGRQTEGKLFRFKYQAGFSYYGGRNEGFYFRNMNKNISALGLTTKVGVEIMPLPFLSISLDLETNINNQESIYMPLLKIGLGKIRPKRRKIK